MSPETKSATSVRYSAPAREFSKNPEASAQISETAKNEQSDRAVAKIKAYAPPISDSFLLLFIKKSPENLS